MEKQVEYFFDGVNSRLVRCTVEGAEVKIEHFLYGEWQTDWFLIDFFLEVRRGDNAQCKFKETFKNIPEEVARAVIFAEIRKNLMCDKWAS